MKSATPLRLSLRTTQTLFYPQQMNRLHYTANSYTVNSHLSIMSNSVFSLTKYHPLQMQDYDSQVLLLKEHYL